MRFLGDTNLWLRVADESCAEHPTAKTAVNHLLKIGSDIVIVPQNLVEFWAVATRPKAANGLGWDVKATSEHLKGLRRRFNLLPETKDIVDAWQILASTHNVIGKSVHDARLVAQMQVHSVSLILTFNMADFARFVEIRAISPQAALSFNEFTEES